ncbi:MAG: ABC transporter ATP-binding protein [Candidatus Thermoplasmatota archaeon]|nr:ABC transporter ATP-binding protein [Candidatus Thermoplasmatota archaeon]
MVSISLKNVTKTFNGVTANDDINLKIEDGEFFTLLGPSGCGKTTTLRIIAGFYFPDKGSIFFDDQDVTNHHPNTRETGMVFQNYALWPHMSVFDNVAYGLKIRKVSKDTIKEQVLEILDLVRLEGLESRTPLQLSGGQQQRVALARALVIKPKVLLLDEPLSNLDAKLRLEMRQEITRIQKKLKITTVYVTHDQEEALSISDRIAIMKNGSIKQVGSPKQVYLNPQNIFIADFIGQCSFIHGKVRKVNQYIDVETDEGIKLRAPKTFNIAIGDQAICAIRPESFTINKPDEPFNVFKCKVLNILFLGKSNRVYTRIGNLNVLAELPIDADISIGKTITLFTLIDETVILPFHT